MSAKSSATAKRSRRKAAPAKPAKPCPIGSKLKPAAKAKPKAATKAKAQPRAKAKAQPAPQLPVTTERLTWDGAELLITYKTHAFGSGSSGAHLEVRALDPTDRPLPITDTGYRSHFLPRGCVEAAGGPGAYVRRWLDEAARSPRWKIVRDRWRQLDLF